MNFLRKNSLILGFSILIGVAVLLLSSSELFFSPGVTFVDTQLHRSSGDQVYVRTKMDFGSQEHMTAFPKEVGQWQGYDYDPTEWKTALGADMIVLRGYEPQTFSQPVFFLIMQSKTETSFHPPEVCYAAQGYKIQEEGKVEVSLTDAIWSKDTFDQDLPFKKLVITKEAEGEITERRLVLYCYVRGNQFTTDTVTMIRVSALIPLEGSYEGVLDIEKDFIDQAIPLMFDPDEENKWNPIVRELAGCGIGGYSLIALLVGIPLAILVYPRTRWGRGMTE